MPFYASMMIRRCASASVAFVAVMAACSSSNGPGTSGSSGSAGASSGSQSSGSASNTGSSNAGASGQGFSGAGSSSGNTGGSGGAGASASGSGGGSGSSASGSTAGSGNAGSGAGNSGTAGATGTTGESGTSAGAGTSGATGTSGVAGASGTGASGAAGATGATGDGGSGATSGSSSAATCPTPALTAGDSMQTVQVGSLMRQYILHVPSAYKGTTAVPLVVDFHPIGGSDTGEESGSPFKAVTDPEGVVTAYPQGEPSPNVGAAWDVGPCCTSPIGGTAVDDVGFAKALVTQVEAKACIDTTRVYAVGFSMGGGMSHYLACHAADVFAAVVPQSFDLLKENEGDCTPVRPIPELSFRGTADNVALYAGGYSSVVTGMPITFLGAQACWEKWASIDGCTDTPAYPQVNGSTWECSYYKQCQGNVQVGVCINNGGHEYGDGNIGWTFLKQFTLP
jgi:polyhydroxybutyrate depolymerase